jgi:hypothetical protein
MTVVQVQRAFGAPGCRKASLPRLPAWCRAHTRETGRSSLVLDSFLPVLVAVRSVSVIGPPGWGVLSRSQWCPRDRLRENPSRPPGGIPESDVDPALSWGLGGHVVRRDVRSVDHARRCAVPPPVAAGANVFDAGRLARDLVVARRPKPSRSAGRRFRPSGTGQVAA